MSKYFSIIEMDPDGKLEELYIGEILGADKEEVGSFFIKKFYIFYESINTNIPFNYNVSVFIMPEERYSNLDECYYNIIKKVFN